MSCGCWAHYTDLNLRTPDMMPADHCPVRFESAVKARVGCGAMQWCGGVTQDNGMMCGGVRKRFELRMDSPDDSPPGGKIVSWFLHRGATNCTAAALRHHAPQCTSPMPKPRVWEPAHYDRDRAMRLGGANGAGTSLRPGSRRACLAMMLQRGAVGRLAVEVKVIDCLIRSEQPFLVGRPSLGSEVMAAYASAVRGNAPYSEDIRQLKSNAGVVAASPASAKEYALAYAASLNISDLSVRWDHDKFPRFLSRGGTHEKIDRLLAVTGHYPNFVVNHEVLEPWLLYKKLGHTYMPALQGRTVLVVTPFVNSIAKNLDLLEGSPNSSTAIWAVSPRSSRVWGEATPQMLPSTMRLKLVRPPLNFGGAGETKGDWRDALEVLKRAVDAAGAFDLALLSCGGLGMLVAGHLRATGRSAMYVGGPLQLHFGIRGKRWYSMPEYRQVMDRPGWKSPAAADRPPKANQIEGGAYW